MKSRYENNECIADLDSARRRFVGFAARRQGWRALALPSALALRVAAFSLWASHAVTRRAAWTIVTTEPKRHGRREREALDHDGHPRREMAPPRSRVRRGQRHTRSQGLRARCGWTWPRRSRPSHSHERSARDARSRRRHRTGGTPLSHDHGESGARLRGFYSRSRRRRTRSSTWRSRSIASGWPSIPWWTRESALAPRAAAAGVGAADVRLGGRRRDGHPRGSAGRDARQARISSCGATRASRRRGRTKRRTVAAGS